MQSDPLQNTHSTKTTMNKKILLALIAPAVAFFTAFWLLPIVRLIYIGTQADKASGEMGYWVALSSPQYLMSFWNTVWVSVLTSLLAVMLAATSALFLARNRFWGRNALIAIMTFPLAFPGVVIGFFVILSVGRQGVLNTVTMALFNERTVWAYSLTGLFIGYLYFSIPRVISTMMAACEKLDPSLEEAAASLGAPKFYILKDVIIPALMPSLVSTGTICFATCMGAFGTIFALGTKLQVVPLSIYNEFTAYSNFAMSAALSIILGLITWLTLLLTQKFTHEKGLIGGA